MPREVRTAEIMRENIAIGCGGDILCYHVRFSCPGPDDNWVLMDGCLVVAAVSGYLDSWQQHSTTVQLQRRLTVASMHAHSIMTLWCLIWQLQVTLTNRSSSISILPWFSYPDQTIYSSSLATIFSSTFHYPDKPLILSKPDICIRYASAFLLS